MHSQVFKQEQKFALTFSRLNGNKKGIDHVVGSSKLTGKPCLNVFKG